MSDYELDDYCDLLAQAGHELEDQLVRENCRESLYEFVKEFWPIVEPGRPFVPGWHLEWMCRELEAISRGDTLRLLINVPPGAMKEICVNELVLTSRGRIRLGDVRVGDKILTHKGRFRSVEAVHEKGQQQTYIITTDHGRKIQPEIRHPFLTPGGWVEARHLKVGDILGAVCPVNDEYTNQITPEEARLLGYFVGDGSVSHAPGFTNADEEILQDFEFCAASVGMITTRQATTPSGLARNSIATKIGIKKGREWLTRFGLLGLTSYEQHIPDAVINSGNEILENFLGAYWSCDGTIVVRHKRERGDTHLASATSVSRRLAYDVQHALLRLGIDARIRERVRDIPSKRQGTSDYRYWVILSQSHEDVVKFRRLKGLCTIKRGKLDELTFQKFASGPLFEDEIISIEDGGMAECRCLTVEEDHSFAPADLAVHNSLMLVFWTLWEWGPKGNTSLRYLCASYTQTLTIRDNRRRKAIMRDPKYMRLFPHVRIDQNRTSDENFGNTNTGWCIATSTGGVGTGERADRVICDDLHSVSTAESDAIRGQTLHWWREVVPTRVNDPQKSAFVVVMQRVHEDDVAGDILENRGPEWIHVCLPMYYEPDRHCVTDNGEDPRTEAGELYWPERFPLWTVERDSIPLGRYGVAAQFQQMPAPRGGGIVLRENWQLWPPNDEMDRWVKFEEGLPPIIHYPPSDFIMAYEDTAFTQKDENAYCALIVFAVFADTAGRPRVIMRRAWRDKPTLRELTIKTLDICRQHKVDVLVIENKAGAEWVKQEMQRQMRSGEFSIILDEPRGDKVARLHSVAPLFEDKMIFAPDKDWAEMVITEVSNFPKGRFADLCDCTSGALGYLRRNDLIKLSVEYDEDEREARRFKGNDGGVAKMYEV
jgi:predicted phage terminase large subunit-like protein